MLNTEYGGVNTGEKKEVTFRLACAAMPHRQIELVSICEKTWGNCYVKYDVSFMSSRESGQSNLYATQDSINLHNSTYLF